MTTHKAPSQLPPSDLDAERTVLASILVDAGQTQGILKTCTELNLQPAVFFEPKHQTIYQACQQMLAKVSALMS